MAVAAVGAAGVVAAVVIAVVVVRWRTAPLVEAACAAGAVAAFAAPYVLAWYPATVLPLSGRALGTRASTVGHVGASVLLVAYVVPAGSPPSRVVLAPAAGWVCGLILAVLVVVLVAGPTRTAAEKVRKESG